MKSGREPEGGSGRGVKLRLRGPLAGKDVTLSGVTFKGGLAEIPRGQDGLAKYLGLCYQAEEVSDGDEADPDREDGALPPVEGDDGGDPAEAGEAADVGGGDDPPPGAAEPRPGRDRQGRAKGAR